MHPLRRQSFFAILAAIVFHLMILFFRWDVAQRANDSMVEDPDAYRHLAIQWSKHGVFGSVKSESTGEVLPTAYRPPLYPWALSWFVDNSTGELSVSSIAWLHAWLGASTCLAAFLLARKFLSRMHPTIAPWRLNLAIYSASALVAIDPILLRQSQLIMTETLATAICSWTLLVLVCFSSLGPWDGPLRSGCVGILFGLGILCRPASLVWFLGTLLVCCLLVQRPRRFAFASTMVLGCSLVVMSWGVRNRILLDRFLVTTTHGGYTLYLANNDSIYDHLSTSWSRDWKADAFFADTESKAKSNADAMKSEWEQDRQFNNAAWSVIQRRPLAFLASCMVREGWLWALWPNQSSLLTRLAIGSWYAAIYAFALLGVGLLVRDFKSYPRWILLGWGVGFVLVLSISGLHAIYWSNMRMRAVCVPTLSLLAVAPIVLLKGRSPKSTIRYADRVPIDRIQS